MKKVKYVILRLGGATDMGYMSQHNGLQLAATFDMFQDRDTVKVSRADL